jgi:D-glycero-alpha-D-manno-heptose-7-phosphate kinase
MPSKMDLAKEAIYIEQKILKENVGAQDQTLAAIGGFNRIEFGGSNHMHCRKVTINNERLESFQNHLALFFTGFSRIASEVAAEQIKNMSYKKKELRNIQQMVDEAIDILNGNNDLSALGKLLGDSWKLKRSLSTKVSTPYIDDIYNTALRSGAIGGKLLGAGGGGFILFFAKPENQSKLRRKLKHLLYVPFRFENLGSQIIFYEPDANMDKRKR